MKISQRQKLKFPFWGVSLILILSINPFYVFSNNNENINKNSQKPESPSANLIKVNGIVSAETGEPLIGVSVIVVNSSNGTITDFNGRYSISAPANSELTFSYIGFNGQVVGVNNRTTINVTLKESTMVLEDLVVVGYGTQKKESVVGALATVATKDLLQSPQANVSNALAGRMPGLLSVQRTGEPGNDASTIRIRGIGTFTEGGQEPLVLVDGIESDNYNNIDPNEIENLTILKDASATAVYGVRGANGVIIITTKRGVKGKPQLSLTTNAGVSNFPFIRKNMNSYQYALAYTEAENNDAYSTNTQERRFRAEEIEAYRTNSDPVFYPNVDWYDLMLRSFSTQSQTNLNIRGGTDNVRYFTSVGYFTQDGMMNTDVVNNGYNSNFKYTRYNIRSNFDIDITRNLLMSIDLSSQLGETRGPNWNTSNIMLNLATTPPNAAPGVIDGKIMAISYITGSAWTPLATFNKGWHTDYENNLNASLRLNYKMDYLLKGLSLRGALSYKNFNTEIRTFSVEAVIYEAKQDVEGNKIFVPQSDPKPKGVSISTPTRNRRIYLETGIAYDREFGLHHVTGLALYNQSKYYDPGLLYLIPNGYQGVVGRVTYDYDNRYLAEYNIGYNGTENFAVGKRFGTFPAYSLGWVLTNESFFPENDYMTFIKLRASYGVVGNDKIGGARFLYQPSVYVYTDISKPGYYFGDMSNRQGYQTSSEGKMGNPDLTWEKAKKTNIGADLKFFKDKLSLTVDYFIENRNNILVDRLTIPDVIGMMEVNGKETPKGIMPAANFGEMTNSGYEGELTWNDAIGKFRYFVKANYTFVRNKVVFKDEVSRKYAYRMETGQRYGQFFGLVADGLYNSWEEVNDANRPVYQWSSNKLQPGDIKYVDINGDGIINDDDQVPIGYSNFPEKMFGITLGGSYNGFDFSVLFQGAGNVSYYPTKSTQRGFYEKTSAHVDLVKSWSPERYEQGLEIKYPRYSIVNNDHNYRTSTFWLQDASYMRLKNVEVGYSIQGEVLKKIGMSSVRVYANGNNLLTWTRMRFPGKDPESLSNGDEMYPVTRIFNLGLNVNF